MRGLSDFAPLFGAPENLGDAFEDIFDEIIPPQGQAKGPATGLAKAMASGPGSGQGAVLPLAADNFVFAVETGNDDGLHDHDAEHTEADATGQSVSAIGVDLPNAASDDLDLAYQRPDGVGGGPPGGGNDDPPPPSQYGTNDIFAEYFSGGTDVLDELGAKTTDYFNVEVEFYGDWSLYGDYMDAFAYAAEFLSSIMTQGLADDPDSFSTFDPFGTNKFTVDDVLIEARLSDIDGAGNILGGANVFSARTAGTVDQYTAVVGFMEFDTADILTLITDDQDNGTNTWDEVVLHEMIHALGFGTLWDNYYADILTVQTESEPNLATRNPNDTIETVTGAVYNGAAGNAEFSAEGNGDKIAVETDYGSGTALAHWDENTYADELMTGILNTTTGGNLADWSIAALADIGYYIDPAALDDLDTDGNEVGHNALSGGVDLETWYTGDTLAYINYDADGTPLIA